MDVTKILPKPSNLKRNFGADDASFQANGKESSMGNDSVFAKPTGLPPAGKTKKIKIDHSEENEDASAVNDNSILEGLTEEQRRLLAILDAGDEAPAAIDVSVLKKTVLKFEKAISKNQELRVRFADQPMKFIESEADLDEEIKNMATLSADPSLYPYLIQLNAVDSIVSLLAHENSDICISAIELLNTLTDQKENMEEDELEPDAQKGVSLFVRHLIDIQAHVILGQTLSKLNESVTEDKQGVFNILNIFENIVTIEPTLMEPVVSDTTLITYLLNRILQKPFDSVKEYASEMLSILTQQSKTSCLAVINDGSGGVDVLLQVVAAYKRKDPKEVDEAGMMENVFNVMCSLVQEPEGKAKEKKMSRIYAIKVLSNAVLGTSSEANEISNRFMEVGGLKMIFPIFMGKYTKKLKKDYQDFSEATDDEHVISIILSLLKYSDNLPEYRLRLLRKFIENEYEKVMRLLTMRDFYNARVSLANQNLEKEREDMQEDQEEAEDLDTLFYLKRLDAGLFTLQMIDQVVAMLWVDASEPTIKECLKAAFSSRNLSLEDIKSSLDEFLKNLGEEDEENPERNRILDVIKKLN